MTDTSASQKRAGLTKLGLRLFQGILPFDRSRVLADIIAGLTLAAVGIPEVMGYTNRASGEKYESIANSTVAGRSNAPQ